MNGDIQINQKEKFGIESAIIEIRAGAGGEEAGLFANDLFRMYSKYAKSQGWEQGTLDSHLSELGGIKEITFELKGSGAFSKMRFEGGVHRVQRIPTTEKRGRVHTSTVSVAVLAKPKFGEIKIRPEDLEIDFYCSSGAGGQYVQKRQTAVRILHKPSGIVVTCQTERNQKQNKENAMHVLEARLLEEKEIKELEERGDDRRAQIKRAMRSEKTRTYNFPQNRLTDHRAGKSWHNLEDIIEGKLESVIKTLEKKFGQD